MRRRPACLFFSAFIGLIILLYVLGIPLIPGPGMREEEYAGCLDLVDLSAGEEQEGEEGLSGRTYSDVALLLTQYKGAIKRFGNERM